MSKYQWVVLDAVKQQMRCNHCDESEPLSIINGKRVDFAVGVMKAFFAAHKKCRKSEAA
jgi:hypothetical protein